MIGRSHVLPWQLCPCRQCRWMRPGEKRRIVKQAKLKEKKIWRQDWGIR